MEKKKHMGLFDKIFKSEEDIAKKEIVEVPWNMLTKTEQLDELVKESKEQPVVIFKHSTRCGISRMVLKQFENSYDFEKDAVKLYFLDLLEYRNVSNAVAEKFGVHHESPQLIILRNGQVVHHASHQDITTERIREYLG